MQINKPMVHAAMLFALGTFGSLPARANLVTNGGFETGGSDGWTTAIDPIMSGVDSSAPQSGNFAAYFGNVGNVNSIGQTLTTVPGATYTISFWLQNESDVAGNSTPNAFEFDWDGIARQLITDAPAFNYTHYTFAFMASAAATDLTFKFSQTPAFWDFDSVEVEAATAAVPEPNSLLLLITAGAVALAALRTRQKTP